MGEEVLLKERRGLVGTLTLNRPEKGNSISVELMFKLIQALEEWAREDDIRTLVVTGAGGKAFCSGFDVEAIPTDLPAKDKETTDAINLTIQNPLEHLMDLLNDYPYPTIAMLNGNAIGAGFNLAMCCDLRIAAGHVRMGIPPAKLGLVYHPEGIRQVAEAIGMARAREVFFTGRLYDPVDVKAMGLVHKTVTAAELPGAVATLAEEIAENAPLSLKGIKKIFSMYGRGLDFREDDLRQAELIMAQAFVSEDLKEGRRAFLEKRKPHFKGR